MATLQKVDHDPFAPSAGGQRVAKKPTLQRVEGNPFAGAPAAAPRLATKPKADSDPGFGESFARGFKRTLPETKSLLYGASAALGGAVGAEGARDWGLENYQRVQREEVAPLQGDASFKGVLAGEDGIGEYAGDVLGNFAGQALQSAAAGAAGAAIGGGAGSVVPGAGTAAGGVTGAIGGFVARGAVKKLINKEVRDLIEDQVKKGVSREAAEAAGKAALQKRLQQLGGAAVAGTALNVGQETGISYTGRAEDAAAAGEELGQYDAARALGAGAVAGALDTAAEAVGVGRLLRGASPNPRMARRVVAGAAAGAATEGATEAAQGAVERFGAQRDLTSREAIDDYIENAAAGVLGGGVMGGASGVRRNAARPRPQPQVDQAARPMLALPPPGPITVDSEGGARTEEQRYNEQRADADFTRGREDIGLTPDVNRARARHPSAAPVFPNAPVGSLSDAANATPAAQTRQAARPRPSAAGMPDAQRSAVPESVGTINQAEYDNQRRMFAQQLAAAQAAGDQTAMQRVIAERAAFMEQAGEQGEATSRAAEAPAVPWIDRETGEVRDPDDSEIEGYIHDQLNQQMRDGRGVNTAVVRKALALSGLPAKRRNPLVAKVKADRKQGITSVVPAASEAAEQAEAAPPMDPQRALEQDRDELDAAMDPTAAETAAPLQLESFESSRQEPLRSADSGGSAASNTAGSSVPVPAGTPASQQGSDRDLDTVPSAQPAPAGTSTQDAAPDATAPGAEAAPQAEELTGAPAAGAMAPTEPVSGTELAPKRAALNVRMGGQEYPVDSVEDASARFLELRDTVGDIGGMSAVELVDDGGRAVGYIGHNGEVYEGSVRSGNPRAEPVYDPQTKRRYGSDVIDGTAAAAAGDAQARPRAVDGPSSARTDEAAATSSADLSPDSPAAAYKAAYLKVHGEERALPDSSYAENAAAVMRAIENKDVDALLGRNLTSAEARAAEREFFQQQTGVKLPKGRKASEAALDAWGGVTPEQRAAKTQARKAEVAADAVRREVRHAATLAARAQVNTSEEGVVAGDRYVDSLMERGYTNVVRRGRANYLANAAGEAFRLPHKYHAAYARARVKANELEPQGGVQAAAAEAATSPANDRPEPTEAQKEAGNYKKGHTRIAGLDVSIENPAGSRRRPEWPPLEDHYGYFKGSVGADKDHVDVFLTDRAEDESLPVFVVDQRNKDGSFDEHKVVMGATDEVDARATYLRNYEKGWTGLGAITQMTQDEFKAWVKDPARTKRPAADEARSAPPEGVRAAQSLESRQARAAAQFTRNRAAIADNGLRKGDTVSFQSDGRTFTGEILSLGDKEQAVVAVGVKNARGVADYHVGAAHLSKVEPAVNATAGTQSDNQASPAFQSTPKPKAAPKAKASAAKAPPQAAATPAAKPPRSTGNTEDAGAELWYNRRNRLGRGIDWNDVEGLNATLKVKEVTKAKVWPRPDYQQLVADGLPAPLAHVVKQVYDALAAKPRLRVAPTDEHLREYIETVGQVRDAVFAWLKDGDGLQQTLEKAVAQLKAQQRPGMMASLATTGQLDTTILDAVFPKHGEQRWRGSPAAVANNRRANVIGGNKATSALQVSADDLARAVNAVADGWPTPKEAWERLYKIQQYSSGFSVRRAGRSVASGLATRDEAEAAAKAHYEATKRTGTGPAQESRAVEEAQRQGPDRRAADEDITSDRLKETFGLRGVNFGDWMKGDAPAKRRERQLHLNHAYDAFMDLADLLGLPPKAISLNGLLGLAFGAQGRGGRAAAHFVPGVNEINLTRTHGAGGIAHEWSHALDHYFAVQSGETVARAPKPYLTQYAGARNQEVTAGVRPEIREAFATIVEAMQRRPVSREEVAQRHQTGLTYAKEQLGLALNRIETLLGNTAALRDGVKPGTVKREFDAIAARLQSGDQGEGRVDTGRKVKSLQNPRRKVAETVSQATGQLLSLVRDSLDMATPLPELMEVDSRANLVAYQTEQVAQLASHTPQKPETTRSEYVRAATRLESRSGDAYWSTPWELFARAFESYVTDRLDARSQRNDYLAWPQLSETAVEELQAVGAIKGDPYPRGAERERINAAFDSLMATVQTREDDAGNVALFSKADAPIAVVEVQRASGAPEELWRTADQHYRDQLQGTAVDGPDGEVRFANAGRTKALSTGRRDPIRMGVAMQLGELARVAPIYAQSADRSGDQTLGYAYAIAPVSVDGKDYAVRLVYRRNPRQTESQSFYTFDGFEMSEPGAIDRGRRSEDQLDVRGSPGSGYTVAQLAASLNQRPTFSRRAAAQHRGLDLARAQALKQELTAQWGDDAPSVRLVESAEALQRAAGLPASVLDDPDFYRAEGVYRGQPVVWINVGAIATEQRFGQVLAHEALGHYGVERVVGKAQWKEITDAIERHAANGTGAADLRRAIAHVRRTQPGVEGDRLTFAKEVIAVMAEQGARNGLIGRVVAAVRRYLRRVMPGLQWSERDIRDLLAQADGVLRRGRTAEQRRELVQQYAFSRGEDEVQQAEELDVDAGFVAGLSPAERSSAPMVALARGLWSDMGTASPFFQEWFGDSKVVDKDGQPLKVYHGTGEEFAAFDGARAGKSTNHLTARLGIFFDSRKSKAEHYARVATNDVPAEMRVIEGHLSIQKPYVMSKDEFMGIEGTEQATALRQRLEREGYDGIQLPDVGQWVIFSPSQVKATDNRGTFNRADDRLLFSKAAADPSSVIDDVEAVMDATRSDGRLLERARAALKAAVPKRLKDAQRPTWLATLTTRHLTELGSDYFGTMRIYSDYLAEMGADRNKLATEGEGLAEKARKWSGKNKEAAQRLFRLMHDATIQGVDPAEDYQPLQFKYGGQTRVVTPANIKEALTAIREQMRGRGGDNKTDMLAEAKMLRGMPAREKQRVKKYPSLVERWNELPPEAQALYAEMRDMYKQRSEQVEAALVARINDTDVPDNHKRGIINTIRMQFELQRLQGVYFPLQRFGKFFVAAERNNTPTFLMFEKLDDLERAVKDLRGRGFTIKAQGLKSDGKASDAPSGTFVAEVMEKLNKAGVSNQTQDAVYQLYLQALPELSMRKHAIHRQSVPGFDPDAVRAFAYNMHHGAHQLAKLRFMHKLQDVLDVLRKQQDGARREDGADTRRIAAGDAVLDELARRHDWISNPQDSAATNLVSSFGFVYYLGLTPAAALVNLTQTALVTYPFLAARFGPVKAMNYLLAAGRDAGRTVGNIQKTLTNPEEARAHQVLQASGALDKTQAHNLAGIAEGGMQGYNPAWARAMEIIGWGFHKAEVINREASGIAAFRLARAEGQSFDEAVKFAADTINDTHFDYTNANRARFMQSGTAKVLLMFRQYSLNMTWHLGRMLWNATKGESAEVKRIARRNLTGVLGMSALFSGVMGLPTMGVVMGALNAIASSFGDDDEPWDAETEFRAFLVDMLGPGAASILLGGVVNEVTGADIAGRVGLDQLWLRDSYRELEGRDAYYHLLEQAAGPMGGVLKNALVGKQLVDEGHVWRGVETTLPKALKDVLKAGRYAVQGVNSLRGDPLLEDLSLWQTLLQAQGFTPNEVAKRYDRNSALKNYEQHILDRRQYLVNAFAMAHRTGDSEGRREAIAAITKFNRTHPEIAVTTKSIRRSLLSRASYSAKAEGGIILNRKLAAKVREAVGE